jgi:trimeric autotransporter adhesin
MRGKSRWVMFVVSLAVVLAIADDRAQSQAPAAASTAAAPFQIKQTAYLKASNPHATDHFACGGNLPGHSGNAIAISDDGNFLAIGAHQESSAAKGINGNQNDTSLYSAGAVYVFVRRGATWAQQAYVKASDPQMGANFGMNVAFNSDATTMAVSAAWESSSSKGINSVPDDKLPQAGAVYLFTRTGDAWSQQAYIKASNTGRAGDPKDPNDWGDGDQFGFSIALSGDGNVLAAGALSEDSRASGINTPGFQDDDSAPDAGAVYIFTRTGATWTQRDYLKSSNNDGGDRFGFGVALSANGNTLVASSYDEGGSGRSTNSIPDNLRGGSGAVYIFDRVNDAWRQTAYLKGSQQNRNDAMGVSVGISDDGNTVVAGAGDDACLVPGINAPCREATWPPQLGAGSAGGAYVWVRNGNAWVEQAYLKATNPELEDLFGVRVSISGDGNTIVAGDPNEDSKAKGINGDQADNSADGAGAAFVFTRTGTTWTQRAYVKGSNTEAFDAFGSAVTISGDGKTIVLGAPIEASAAKGVNANQADNTAQGAGAAYVFTVN